IRVGFTDTQDIPHNLPLASRYLPGVKWDKAVYYLSTVRLAPPSTHRLRDWRRRLFALMFRNQADRVEVFHLPPDRTVVLGAELTGSLPRWPGARPACARLGDGGHCMARGDGAALAGVTSWLARLLKGVAIGVGAILPGLSGGVLAVIFGVYEPMIRFLGNL